MNHSSKLSTLRREAPEAMERPVAEAADLTDLEGEVGGDNRVSSTPNFCSPTVMRVVMGVLLRTTRTCAVVRPAKKPRYV